MSYKNVLIAVDLSSDSKLVMERAKGVVTGTDAVMHLVHVVRPLDSVYSGFGAVGLSGEITAQAARLEQEAYRQAEEQVAGLAKDYGIDAKNAAVRTGQPAAEIRAAAEDCGADLIIMGTHARHGLGLLLGSTANGVLHGVPCDILAVRVAQD